ncbi:MAG: FkbM family methyltransferase [Marinibacterium sp.]
MTAMADRTSPLAFAWWRLGHRKLDRLRRDIVDWAETGERRDDPEIREVSAFLRHNPPDFLPYDFARAYHARDTVVEHDADTGLNYVLYGDRRLYWREGRKTKRIPRDYHAILAEQDVRSPHRYLTDGFDIEPGDIVTDVGSAEGILALDVIERAGHVYLFEADERWADALAATFRPWRDKVTIVPKYAGDETTDTMTTLDDFFGPDRRIDFLKLDVEGYEGKVLDGARGLIGSGRVKRAAVCAYHRAEDEANLNAQLQGLGFATAVSQRYMLLYREEGLAPPYLRRGLLRATWPG